VILPPSSAKQIALRESRTSKQFFMLIGLHLILCRVSIRFKEKSVVGIGLAVRDSIVLRTLYDKSVR
jgi:hypothetical protein